MWVKESILSCRGNPPRAGNVETRISLMEGKKKIHSEELREERFGLLDRRDGICKLSARHGRFEEIVECVHLFPCLSYLAEFLKDVKSTQPGSRRFQ